MAWDFRVKSMLLRYRKAGSLRAPSAAGSRLTRRACLGRVLQARASACSRSAQSTSTGLEPDRQPQQPFGAALTLPAMPRLELRAGAAEARRILDRRRSRPRPGGPPRRPRRRRRSGTRSPGSARSSRQGGSSRRSARTRAVASIRSSRTSKRLQATLEEPGRVGRGDEPRQPAREVQAVEELVVLARSRRRRGGRRGRRAPSWRCAARRRSRARAGAAGVGRRAWRRTRRAPDARRPPRSPASSASGSTVPRAGSGRPRRAAAPVWSYSTASTPHGRRWSNSCLWP